MNHVAGIVATAVAISAISALSRQALADFSFSDMEELLRKQNRTKQDLPRVERFAERIRDYRLTFRLLDVGARLVAAVGIVALTAELTGGLAISIAAMAVLVLVLDSVLRPLGGAFAEAVTLRMLTPWTVVFHLLWLPTLPFRACHQAVDQMLKPKGGDEPDEAEEEIMAAVSAGEYAGHIEEHEREMIESVLELREETVDRLMTPRTDMNAVSLEEGIQGAVQVAKQTGHSRLPVYDGNRDNIVGVCYVKDLVGLLPDDLPPIREVVRTPLLIPASKKVSELLKEFRDNKVHLAIVIDEYGGTAGLITIEDIIEEVFGEIDDEYDEEREEEVRAVTESVLELDARMHVDEVNERFDVNLPEDEHYESLGGLLTSQLGHIPKVEESWHVGGVSLTVVEATDRRVVRVRLERDQEEGTDRVETRSA